MSESIISKTEELKNAFNKAIVTNWVKSAYRINSENAQEDVLLMGSEEPSLFFTMPKYVIVPESKQDSIEFEKAVHRQAISYVSANRALGNPEFANFVFSNAYNAALLALVNRLGSKNVIDSKNTIQVEFFNIEPDIIGYEMRTTITRGKSNE